MKTVTSVEVDEQRTEGHSDLAGLNQAGKGWFHDSDASTLWVLIPAQGELAHRVRVLP